jgi:hypothetical protein
VPSLALQPPLRGESRLVGLRSLGFSCALVAVLALVAVPAALADLEDETALAERYAPVVRLVEQKEECGPGEPYRPLDVNLVLDEPTVALRGPWNAVDLVRIRPTAGDLVGRYEYHLDFPGTALEPGCDYERWSRRIAEGTAPTVYGHVATEAGHPERLALQYWFFYAFNDFNNLHEGDWEMIQLVFDAPHAAGALAAEPADVGYSSHEGAESADWGDDKLEVVDDTHPVVYPAAGSHANKYTDALYLGSSAEAGVGCDDTRGPHVEVRPAVKTIPSDGAAAQRAFPWIGFEGRWGEIQRAFFNGPTGPNLKTQWTEPIEWSEGWRERSYAVPTGGVLGTGATDFFCSAVATGSRALVSLLRNPQATLLVLGGLLLAVLVGITRTRWRPGAPLRVARRRAWGQTLSAAARMYFGRPGLFLGIGLLFVPLGLVISLVQGLILGGIGLAEIEATGEAAGALALLTVAVGTTLALAGFALVQAATVSALVEIDAGRPVSAVKAYSSMVVRLRPLLGGIALAAAAWVVLSATAVLIPVAIWLAVRWALFPQVVALEGGSAIGGLRRSARLVRDRWLHVGSLVGVGTVLAFVAGPLVGALLILLTDLPLALLNVVAGIVYALAMPFVALTTAYVYFDTRARKELEVESELDELPAEISLTT